MTSVFQRSSVALAIALTSIGTWANSYQIVDLGANEDPTSVNSKGVVAANKIEPRERGQVFRGGRWRNLAPQTTAHVLNENGDVVGVNRKYVSTLWLHARNELIVEPPVSGATTVARGLNDDRFVVGDYLTTSDRCFMWSPNSAPVDLGTMGRGTECAAFAVNNSLQITGSAATNGSANAHAFIWKAGKFQDLGVIIGATQSEGYSINASGQVVGILDGQTDQYHAFLWAGMMIDLDPSTQYFASQAMSINDSGDIVGLAQTAGDAPTIAVRFGGQKVIALKDEVLELDDWRLYKATSINSLGTIVGMGVRADGKQHAFMLIPQ